MEKCDIVLNRGVKPLYLHIMVRYPAASSDSKIEGQNGDKTVVMNKVAKAVPRLVRLGKFKNVLEK